MRANGINNKIAIATDTNLAVDGTGTDLTSSAAFGMASIPFNRHWAGPPDENTNLLYFIWYRTHI